jgi:magnesium-transporting ATPase (P-type)
LRTLLLGKAEMTLEEWDVLSKEIYEARKINDKKKSKIEFEKVVLKIEKNLELVGATALEDKVNL